MTTTAVSSYVRLPLAAALCLMASLPAFAQSGSQKPATPATTKPAAKPVESQTPGQGPTLADIARREADRRKALKIPGKVYTKEDLANGGALPPAAATPAAPAAAAGEQKPAEPEAPKEDEKNEAWWRGRMNQAREEIRRNEMFLEALQSRINSLSADFVNRDDPAQRAKIGEDRQKALAEQSRVNAEIEAAKKKMVAIEEEARQAGVPPGWLR
jgi:hypothetical protein